MFTVKLPQYTIGEGSLRHLGRISKAYGKRLVVIGGKTALEKTKKKIEKYSEEAGLEIVDFIWYGGECSHRKIEILKSKVQNQSIDLILGVGGGKALDTAKAVGDKTGIPVITIPTISATCAATTMLSVVYDDDGSFDSIYLLSKPPAHILMDTEIISKAPSKYLWAGMGDTLAKYYELEATTRGKELNHSMEMAKNLSIMCVEPIIKYGAKALEDNKKGSTSLELEETILNIIITTGLVSMLIGDEYNGACAHGLFNALTSLKHIEENHLHGEVVAYGVLVMLMLDEKEEEAKALYPFYKSIHLPTSLKDLGLREDKDYLQPLLESAAQMEDTLKMPYRVTAKMFFNAIEKLENFNINFKSQIAG